MIPNIFIAGYKGMVGSSLVRLLKDHDVKIITKDRKELDLLDQKSVLSFFKNEKSTKYIWQPQKLVAFMPTTLIQRNLFIKI